MYVKKIHQFLSSIKRKAHKRKLVHFLALTLAYQMKYLIPKTLLFLIRFP